jgi:hypothetical protein
MKKLKTLWVCASDLIKDNEIGVYKPKEHKPGDVVRCFSIPTSPLAAKVRECKFVELTLNDIVHVFKHPASINDPVYLVSWDFVTYFGLDWDGDLINIF